MLTLGFLYFWSLFIIESLRALLHLRFFIGCTGAGLGRLWLLPHFEHVHFFLQIKQFHLDINYKLPIYGFIFLKSKESISVEFVILFTHTVDAKWLPTNCPTAGNHVQSWIDNLTDMTVNKLHFASIVFFFINSLAFAFI